MSKDRVAEVIEQNLDTTFEFGTWDCCIFAFEVAIPDHLSILINQYTDEDTARDLIDELGGFDAKLQELGGQPIAKEFLRTGDVVKLRDKDTLGVVQSNKIVIAVTRGIRRIPMKYAEKGWRFPSE